MKTSSQERYYMLRALDKQMRRDCARLTRLTTDEKRWDCEMTIAIAADLIKKIRGLT